MFAWLKGLFKRDTKRDTARRPFFDPVLNVRAAGPEDLIRPDVIDLFLRARWYPGIVPMEVLEECLEQLAARSGIGVLVGLHGSTPKALAIILPPRRLSPTAQVFHFFNDGPSALRALLAEKVVAWLAREGYDKAMAFAVRGGPAWERAFSVAEPKKIGDVYELSASTRE